MPGVGVRGVTAYVLVAAAVALASSLGVRLPTGVELGALAAAVLLLGVPHGSLDVLHARDSYRLGGIGAWGAFLLAYVLVGAGVVGAWSAAPAICLVGLLAISAFHFSGDLDRGAPTLLRVVHGLAPVCLPGLQHRDELGELFAALAPLPAATSLAAALSTAAPVLLLASILATAAHARRHRTAAVEVAATAALCAAAPPLLGFGVYFCLLHARRHVGRTRQLYVPSASTMLWAAWLPTAATALAGAIAFALIPAPTSEAGALRVVFVGLAALTVPHMLLIEPIRLRGWRRLGPTAAS